MVLALSTAGAAEPSPEAIRAAVDKALPLIQRSAAEYARRRDCFSCHHQALPALAMNLARPRGFAVDAEVFRDLVAHTESDLHSAIESYRKGNGQGGGTTRAGYALWALALGDRAGDETTTAVVEFLLVRDRDRGYWRSSSRRPPSEVSPFTSTFLALRGLQTFGTPEQRPRIVERTESARRWLVDTQAVDTEDHVFRLWGLMLAGAGDEAIRDAAKQLRDLQRPDGGWAQTEEGTSDAYATGSALVALHEAGGLAGDDPSYRRGLAFLIAFQHEDGSWLIQSRSRPFQTYFETGFPYGPDQFISMAGSSWATAALALACPVPEEHAGRPPGHRRVAGSGSERAVGPDPAGRRKPLVDGDFQETR